MKLKEIAFVIDAKKILNSNSMPSSWFVKSSRASFLRALGSSSGVEAHEDKDAAQEVLQRNLDYNNIVNMKSQLAKKLKKQGLSKNEQEEELALFDSRNPLPPAVDFIPMFNVFEVEVIVQPPTARRIDPVNLYPTCKPLIDGLTDCGWWADDDFKHLKKISFSYGGVSEVKKHFTITFIVKELSSEEATE